MKLAAPDSREGFTTTIDYELTKRVLDVPNKYPIPTPCLWVELISNDAYPFPSNVDLPYHPSCPAKVVSLKSNLVSH